MPIRRAECSCGQLSVSCDGEPVRISVCHCLACQRRTGSVFGVQARWPRGFVKVAGDSSEYVRVSDDGNDVVFHFCPKCGTTVYYWLRDIPDVVAVAVGAFAEPAFPEPKFSVYETRKHSWVAVTSEDLERFD